MQRGGRCFDSIDLLRGVRPWAIRVLILLVLPVLVSCQGERGKRWKAPEFVKEWEIREIKPGVRHQIFSMTATDKGVFLLVNAKEIVYHPPQMPKPVSEMTEEEKETFIDRYVSGKSLSGIAAGRLNGEERDTYIDFIIKHFFPPRKASEMEQEEKDEIISFLAKVKEEKETETNKGSFRKVIESLTIDGYIDMHSGAIARANREELEHYRIQHYDFEGNFIKQWPDGNKLGLGRDLYERLRPVKITRYRGFMEPVELDSRQFLIMPLIMVSDHLGNIYVVDYKGNKVVKFDSNGAVLALWWLEERGSYDSLSSHRGAGVQNGRLVVAREGDRIMVPQLREYTLEGKLKRKRNIEPPKVPARMPVTGAKVPFLKYEGNVGSIGVDSTGGVYLFAEDNTVVVLDRYWNKKKQFTTVLKKGFESPGRFYDPDRRREIGYEEVMLKDAAISLRQFTSEKLSWTGNSPGYYYANGLYVSPQDEIYVTFVGMKPFGVIDAMIFDTGGEMIGYWKHKKKSYSEWFERLSDIERIETFDEYLSLAFYGSHVFIGRTLHEGRGRTGIHNVVQKFTKMEGAP